jgi:segregation and condensation protein B
MTQTVDAPETEQRASETGNELDLTSRVEALLFVADEPVSAKQVAEALQVDEGDVEAAVDLLGLQCQGRGLRLQRQAGALQLTTAPQAASDVERFLGLEASSRLSTAALETLALIAYRQPVTRGQVEAVRGVNCDGVLRTLLARGLVSPQGRLDQAGRPILYGTTSEFLQYFGLADLSQLPALERFRDQAVGGEPNAT